MMIAKCDRQVTLRMATAEAVETSCSHYTSNSLSQDYTVYPRRSHFANRLGFVVVEANSLVLSYQDVLFWITFCCLRLEI